jgi:hypothetical protein
VRGGFRVAPISGSCIRGGGVTELGAHLSAALAGTHPVERAVDDDPVKPRPKWPPAVEAIERAQRGQHRFLRDVLGRARVLVDQEGRTVRVGPVPPDQRLHCVCRSAPGLADQSGLVTGNRGSIPRT